MIRPRLCTRAPIFLNLFQNLTVAILLVIGDVPIDCEASVVTSPILRICQLSLLEVLVEVELRVCVEVSMRVFVNVYICTMFRKKNL